MSEPALIRGQYVNLFLQTAAGPPAVFTLMCGLTARGLTEQVNTSDSFVRDCALPDAIPVRRVNTTGKQWDLTGTGKLNRAQMAVMQAAVGVTKNWRYDFGQPAGDAVYGGHYTGPGVLESIEYGSADGEFVDVTLSIKSDGTWAFTVVP